MYVQFVELRLMYKTGLCTVGITCRLQLRLCSVDQDVFVENCLNWPLRELHVCHSQRRVKSSYWSSHPGIMFCFENGSKEHYCTETRVGFISCMDSIKPIVDFLFLFNACHKICRAQNLQFSSSL